LALASHAGASWILIVLENKICPESQKMIFSLKTKIDFETNPSATGRYIYRVILCQRKYF
jgi:hypothetical protein